LAVINGATVSCDDCRREPCEPDLAIAEGTGNTGVRVGVVTPKFGRDEGFSCGSGAGAAGMTVGFRDIETIAGSSNGGGAAFAAGVGRCTGACGGDCTNDGGAGGGAKPWKAGGGAFMTPGGAKLL